MGWEDNFISEWNSYYQDKAEEKHQDVMEAAARTGRGKSAEITGEILTFLGEAGIDALFSILTGGVSTAAKLGSKGGKIAKAIDKTEDLIEFEDLKRILGNNAPKSFDEYKYLKYNETEKWDYIKGLKGYLEKYPNSDKKYFDAMVKLKEKGIYKGVLLPPVSKQAFILPEGEYDSYHIMKRMVERSITDDTLKK